MVVRFGFELVQTDLFWLGADPGGFCWSVLV